MCKYLESFNPVWRTDLVSAGLAMPRYLLRWKKTKQKTKKERREITSWFLVCVPEKKTRPKQMLIGGCSPGWHRANMNLHNLIPRHIDPRPLVGDLLWPTRPQGFSNSGQGQFRRGHVVFPPTVRSIQAFLLFLTRVHFLCVLFFVQRFNKRKLGLGVRTSARGKLSLLARRKPVNSGGLKRKPEPYSPA